MLRRRRCCDDNMVRRCPTMYERDDDEREDDLEFDLEFDRLRLLLPFGGNAGSAPGKDMLTRSHALNHTQAHRAHIHYHTHTNTHTHFGRALIESFEYFSVRPDVAPRLCSRNLDGGNL